MDLIKKARSLIRVAYARPEKYVMADYVDRVSLDLKNTYERCQTKLKKSPYRIIPNLVNNLDY